MHRDEFDQIAECAGCGAELNVANERGYQGNEWVLCWACALERGGRYDDEEDRWSVDPDFDAPEVGPHKVR